MIAIHPGDGCPRMQFYDTYVVASLVPERAEAGSGLLGDAIALRRYAHPRPGPGTSHACRRDPDDATHAQSPSGDRALYEGRREIADLSQAQVRAGAGEVRPPGASHKGAVASLPRVVEGNTDPVEVELVIAFNWTTRRCGRRSTRRALGRGQVSQPRPLAPRPARSWHPDRHPPLPG